MDILKSLQQAVFSMAAGDLTTLALSIFRWQAVHNPVYQQYVAARAVDPSQVTSLEQIPFLPISFFKQHVVKTGDWEAERWFESSGTTGSATSRHGLQDGAFYTQAAQRSFEQLYGPLSGYRVLALLPGYLERGNSSLVYMAQHFIAQSGSADSGFFLNDTDRLASLVARPTPGLKTLLLGVSFALLDFAESHGPFDQEELIVMETGGMKGRRKEMIREELHAALRQGLGVPEVHSEYGMTELMSQAYAKGGSIFTPPAWMHVLFRDPYDPYSYLDPGKTGGINVIDLANLHSCAFIETGDLGRAVEKGQFEVLGRFDHADIRGCNLLVQ